MYKQWVKKLNTRENQTSSQTSSQNEYEMCIKELGIPQDIPRESLSYTEKLLMNICREITAGEEIDFDELANTLDEENANKLGKIIMKLMW